MIQIYESGYERIAADDFPDKDRLEDVARGIQRILRMTYTRAFEMQQSAYRLPVGTIRRQRFDENSPVRVRAQVQRIEESVSKHCATYLLGWDYGEDENRGELVGLAKTSPQNLHRKKPMKESNYYINDIVSIYEGFGIGSLILDRALSEYPGDRSVTLDAFEGNDRANAWFNRLGFVAIEPQPEEDPFMIGSVVVPQTRLEALSIGLVRQKLQKKS